MNYRIENRGKYVKRIKRKGHLLWLCLGIGFLIGIIYENIVIKSQGTSIRLFQMYYLKKYSEANVVAEDFLWYAVRTRIAPLIIFCLSVCFKWKKPMAVIYMTWTGFLGGILTVAAIIQLGLKGILLCIAGIFPHILFYGVSYGILLMYLYSYLENRWNGKKTIIVILMLFLGILIEVYVNPYLLNLVIRLI